MDWVVGRLNGWVIDNDIFNDEREIYIYININIYIYIYIYILKKAKKEGSER